LLGHIRLYRNVRLRFLRDVSVLTEPSSGKKFKVHEYVHFFIKECNSYSRISSFKRNCGTRHGLASLSVVLVHSEHSLMKVLTHTGLSRTISCTGSIRAETCRRKYDLTQKEILTNKHILMKINCEVNYTVDARYYDNVCVSLMSSICTAPLIFKVLKLNEYKNNIWITSAFPSLIPTPTLV